MCSGVAWIKKKVCVSVSVPIPPKTRLFKFFMVY